MKKITLFLVVIMFSLTTLFAQNKAIGVRLGSNVEVSFRAPASSKTFFELDAGFGLTRVGFTPQLFVTHNWIIASPKWTSEGTWNFFLGIGGGVGFNLYRVNYNVLGYPPSDLCWQGFVGPVGMFGLEYNFEFPLQLSADFRPLIGIYFSDNGVRFYDDFFNIFSPAISARYRF